MEFQYIIDLKTLLIMNAKSFVYVIFGLLCLFYGISSAIENPYSAVPLILGFVMLFFFGLAYDAHKENK